MHPQWNAQKAPRPYQNPSKTVPKPSQDPPQTCLSKEREARRHVRVVEACSSKSEIVLGLLKHVTQCKARQRRDSKQTMVEQRKLRKRKQGDTSESMGEHE